MKKLLIILPLFLTLLSKGQALEQVVDSLALKVTVKYATDSLESSISRDAWWNVAGPIWIDSLIVPLNTSYTFFVQMIVENQTTKETGGEDIKLDVRNNNGVYTIDYNFITYPFHVMKSLTGIAFSIILPPKGAPYMQGTGIAVPIYWHTNRTFEKLGL